ncbi:MAG: hypothetical protein Q7V57_18890 [Actinomycetota bacterium]|nr:hypothetical protein [Actinomycetota bacterium]
MDVTARWIGALVLLAGCGGAAGSPGAGSASPTVEPSTGASDSTAATVAITGSSAEVTEPYSLVIGEVSVPQPEVLASLPVVVAPAQIPAIDYDPADTSWQTATGFAYAGGRVWVLESSQRVLLRSDGADGWQTLEMPDVVDGARDFAMSSDGTVAFVVLANEVIPFRVGSMSVTELPRIVLSHQGIHWSNASGMTQAGPAGLVVGARSESKRLVALPNGTAAAQNSARNALGTDRYGVLPTADPPVVVLFRGDRIDTRYEISFSGEGSIAADEVNYVGGQVVITGDNSEVIVLWVHLKDETMARLALVVNDHQLVRAIELSGTGASFDGGDIEVDSSGGSVVVAVTRGDPLQVDFATIDLRT